MTTGDEPFVGDCDCCGYEGVTVQSYPQLINLGSSLPGQQTLCELCASTLTGAYNDGERHVSDAAVVMKTVCYVGNAILAKLDQRAGG